MAMVATARSIKHPYLYLSFSLFVFIQAFCRIPPPRKETLNRLKIYKKKRDLLHFTQKPKMKDGFGKRRE